MLDEFICLFRGLGSTVMCLSIGTPKNNFSIVPNGILVILGVPKFGQITAA